MLKVILGQISFDAWEAARNIWDVASIASMIDRSMTQYS
jgi:hypothetical protein